jgi:hypothetical protein
VKLIIDVIFYKNQIMSMAIRDISSLVKSSKNFFHLSIDSHMYWHESLVYPLSPLLNSSLAL